MYNGVNTTMREISESTGVSMKTVSRVMKAMQDGDYLHKVRNGKWRLSPRIICNGDKRIGMATINYYDDLDHK
jgi:DNA-binding IclR family transcriptional regulator